MTLQDLKVDFAIQSQISLSFAIQSQISLVSVANIAVKNGQKRRHSRKKRCFLQVSGGGGGMKNIAHLDSQN